MKTINITFLLLFSFMLQAQDSQNVYLFDQFHRGDDRYSGSWGYVAADSSEYALLGAFTGTAIYAIDLAPVREVGFIDGPASRWREITVVGDHAFVTTEANSGAGLQVIDLSNLPDTAVLVTTYSETFTRGHIIQSDIYTDEAFVYVNGTSATGGVHIIDVSEPANPVEVGLYNPSYYIHDSFIKGNRMYSAAGSEGKLDIVDISDKTNPVLIGQLTDFSGYVHSSWITEDDKHLFVAIETDGIPATLWDIEEIDNPEPVANYTANLESLVHNPYIRGNLAFISHNTEGLRVVDLSDATEPIEVGYYDTWAGASGGFDGLWSAFPFFPSGKIIGGNRHDGLYVWTFDEQAARFSGLVKDSLTSEAISNVLIEVQPLEDHLFSNAAGEFDAAVLAGDYQLTFSAENYFDKTLEISLEAGDSLNLIVELLAVVSSVKEVEKEVNRIRVFPNPWKDWTIIDLSHFAHWEKLDQIELYNMEGKKVKEIQIHSSLLSEAFVPSAHQEMTEKPREHFLKLERKNLQQGLYFFNLKTNKGKIVGNGKFVVGFK